MLGGHLNSNWISSFFLPLFLLTLLGLSPAYAQVSPAHCVVSMPATTVGVSSSFTIQLKDASSVNITPASVSLNITFSLKGQEVAMGETITNSSGLYTVSFSTEVAGTYIVDILVDDVAVQNSPFSLVVNTGSINYAGSFSSGDGSQGYANAGDMNVLYYHFIDQFRNPVVMSLSNLQFVVSAGVYSSMAIQNDLNAFIYQSNKTGVVNLTITVLDTTPHTISLSVQISAGPFNPSTSDLEFYPSGARAGDITTVVIRGKDLYGNTLAPVAISSNSNFFLATCYRLDSDGNKVNATYIRSDFDSKTLATSTYFKIDIQLTVAAVYQIEISASNKNISGSPFTFTVTPSDFSPAVSYLDGDFAQNFSPNQDYFFYIYGKDVYGNPQYSAQSSDFLVECYSSEIVTTIVPTNEGNGTYLIVVNLSRTGDFILDAYFDETILTGSGKTLTFYSQSSASQSVAFGAALKSCKVGRYCRLVVQVRDQYGTNQTSSGDQISLTMNGKTIKTTTSTWIGDGNYAVEFVGTSGNKLGVLVNGEPIQGSPFSVYMAPSDGATGVIVAIVILVAVALALVGYIVYKRHQVRKLRKEWELKKALAYKEYQVNQGAPVPLNTMLKPSDEPEWEEEFGTNEVNLDDRDDREWAHMSEWFTSE